ncbi:PilN family type IVB pilus formation outer membrane protein [Luteibacter jiangsuensis]|uniref:PilN family type IVB pilus formation outer membrane protein n=1 Tax=Luteibacter jiangsuensis TaxID=637577 RepID=A0ABX0Q692_9GAMM|nr:MULTISPECIES: PilN family type IVB pilus formation outer membrane protein [Luteibacter]NID04708.1 PilN family type IVB pilus formation outer membrane protein [Luteibacter jiangsuensis]NII55589.1 type IVB pilus formation R64 PilN family outer membrane protein [Luteibacter sp. SG786]
MTTIRTLVRLTMAASIAVALSGCATSALRSAERTNDQDMSLAGAQVATMRAIQAPTVRVHEHGYWVAKESQPLSAAPETVSCDLTMFEASPVTLSQFADKVSRICKIPVHVSADALHVPQASGKGGDDNVAGHTVILGPPQASANNAPEEPRVSLNWQGSLVGLLDSVGAQLDLHWRVRNGAVHIFRTETRTFQIYALPGTDALSSSVTTSTMSSMGIGGGSSGGGGSGGDSGASAGASPGGGAGGAGGSGGGVSGQAGSAQSVATTLTSSVMDDVSNAVSGMLTPGQSKFTLSKATASITVTDSPDVLDRIASYIDHENKLLTTQVVLNVKILNITFDRTDQYGVDWNLAYNSARAGSIGTAATDVKGNTANVHILKGPFKDSSLLIKALSEQGKVSVVTQPSVTTLNLQAVPMQVATQKAYIASVSNTAVAQVGTSTGIQPGTVTTGFNMMLLPYAMADNQLLLQYNISLSDLADLVTMGDKDSPTSIQLPTVDLRAFAQKVRLRSGETLALSGFEQNTDDSQRSGVGSPNNQFLGGSRKAVKNHSVIVILITPVVAS